MHCCLHLHDARIRVEYPVSDDTFSWFCYSSDLNAQSSHKDLGCLLGGFISLFFLSLRETSIILEASKLEIGAEKKDHSSCILSCVNPYFGIGMKDLCLVNSVLSVPELNLSFSPTQLQMMCAFNNLLNIECKHVRSGRLLWGIVRLKFRHSLPPSEYMFYSVVLIAVLWLRLVKEYHYFLLLVGYSEHGVRMPNGGNFPRLAEQQWKIISQIIEKELPAEAIASARRVARFRAALKKTHAEDSVVASMSGRHNSFCILPLAFIWDSTVKILGIIVSVFRLHKKSPKIGQLGMTSEVADPRCCFHLSLGKISAMVSLTESSYPPAHQNSNLRKVTSYAEVSPFVLLIKRFLFIYEESISEKNISFTLGFLEVTSTPVFHKSENKTKPKNVGGVFRGQLKERLDGSETIVRGEPALTCCHSEDGKTDHEDIPILEQISGEMELIWKRMQLIFEECKGGYDKNPWAVCAIHTFLVYPGKSPDSGFLKCNLMAGKLNITLGYASILSFDTLRKQLQHALYQDDGFESAEIPLHSLRTFEESQENQCSGGLKYSVKAMNTGILKLLPDKHLEVRAVIAGPRFQLSIRDEDISSSDSQPNATHVQKGVNLTIDVHNTEFSIWPTVKSGVPSEEHQRPDNYESEFFKLDEHVVEGFAGSFNIKYASKGQITHFLLLRLGGLSLYFEDLMDNHQMQVLVLKPLTVKLSSLRDHLYSFAKSNIASSLSLRGAMSGVTGSLYMDEFSVILQKTCLDASVGDTKAEANASVHEFQAIMFSYKSQTGKADSSDKSEVKNAVIHSADCMHEVSLSSCTFNLLLEFVNGSGARRKAGSEASTSNPKGVFSSLLNIDNLNSKQIHDEGSESNVSASMPSYMLVINITVEKVFIAACSIKNGIFRAHPEDKLHLSLSVGGDFQSIVFGIQGGHIFIETKVLAGFARCVTSYLQFIRNLIKHYLQRKFSETAEGDSNDLGEKHIEEPAQTKTSFIKLELLKAYSIKVSQLSLALLVTDEARVVKEIIGRVDLNLKLWSENLKKKFLLNISHLDILSLILNEGMGKSVENIQMPHFSSVGLSHDSSWFNHDDSTVPVPDGEETSLLSKDASFSSPLASTKSSFANDSASQVVESSESSGNHILERLATSISAEKPISGDNIGPNCSTQGWIGKGYVTGLNLTISLSEIQMLLTTVESLSEISGNSATTDVEERSWTASYQEPEIDLEAALPDGAIVAIQDVHQHLYVTVENMQNKYKLRGAVHYSLAGKRALFRVKWQKRSMWNFSTSWFSLMSLYAKSDSGVPLRLNYLRSSGFVDISSNDDSACSLWKIAPCKHENYEDNADLEPLNHMCKNTFYLVNKKSDCGTAFVHGAMEFVEKPGNPFKFKIFNGLPVVPDLRMTETCPPETHCLASLDGQDISEEAGMAPCISLTIEKISLIIVHELSDPRDKLPLLQGSIDGTELVFQILPQKTRVMSTLTAMLYYFDVYRVIWREFVQPIELCIYWRLTTPSQVTEISNHGMLSRLYFRMQELDFSLTEVLLDMLLYVVGKLDLAGPFAVRNSAILVNCCKVENQLDLDLLCHFHNNQSARVGRRQSAFISLRHLEEPPESSYATILLENPGISSTSSVHVPLSRTQIFAWRTCITSQQDLRTCPGPIIVFDVSKNAEEGLSLNVSPLLRIHNNTGFPVELRIQRPESMEAESASVVLKEGDTVDDCMAAFDAISLCGGPKKALLSLGV
uniref:Vacuolar protein sorting-associated protein 13 VPS13 adaptor binding domain-containing protein n=1 Tax=Chenopodium quinoa TaxID=63459 RepID=A0A803MCN6_CHEQI